MFIIQMFCSSKKKKKLHAIEFTQLNHIVIEQIAIASVFLCVKHARFPRIIK